MSNIHQTGFLAPQSLLQGRYMISETVGEGGMGAVYKAIDIQESNRLVAVKEMSQSQYQNPAKLREAEELFQREGQILSNLSHPNLPRVHAFFNEHGRSYLVMDFIEGKTLEQLLTESATHRLLVGNMLDYALQLCDVLSYLHKQTPPVIFRDLKPSNVMVTTKGNVYLIDFGIARAFKQGLLRDTQNLGTPGFASPEQHGSGQTGPRSDLYSLGATLHYCLTGKEPQSNRPTLFHFLPAHDDNPQVPLNLSELIQRLVATREDQRPPSADAVRHELRYIQRQASSATSNITSGYDVKTACAAQLSSWMIHHTRLPGRLGSRWASTLIPLVANVYGTLCAWFLLTIAPQLKQFYRNSRHALSTSPRNLWQGLFTRQARWMARAVWTPYFIFLLSVFAVTMTGGSLYLLNTLHYPIHLIAFYLCLLLLLLLGGAISNQRIRHPLAHSILAATVLFVGLAAITLFALPEIQPIIRAITFNQLLSLCIVVLITVSLLRPKDRFGWVDHVCLATVAATYALLLSSAGIQAQQQWLAISKQSLMISLDNLAPSVNYLLICLLYIVALIELARCKYSFTGGDRLLLFIVALIATPLQFVYGLKEINHMLFFIIHANNIIKSPSDLVTLNILLTGVPVITALLWLFAAPNSVYLSRLPLVPLALACAALQSFLGPTVQSSQLKPSLQPSASSLGSIMHLNQLITYGLVLIIIVLFCRWFYPFRRIEQFSLFYVAIVGALLQNAVWNTGNPFTSSSTHSQSPQGTTIPQSQLYTLAINKLLAQAFTLIVLTSLAIAIISIFVYLAYQFAWATRQLNSIRKRFTWINKLSLRLNHILLLVTTITCISLLWLFGSDISLLKPTLLSIPSFNGQAYNLTFNQLIILLLVIGSIIALVRLSQPFGSTDRWIILTNAIVCALLLFSSFAEQEQQSKIMKIKLLADPHIVLPSQGIALGLLFAVLVSFMWVKRKFPQPYGSILKIGFSLALICVILQWFVPFFLLAGLIIITLSIILTTQVEQVQ